MAMEALRISHVSGSSPGPHLEPNDVARYVDGAMDPETRAVVNAHLASCDDCRAEVAEVSAMAARIQTRRRRRSLLIPAGAVAAATILVLVLPRGRAPSGEQREPPLAMAISPRALAPVGVVDSSISFSWTSVPDASRYEVRVFDSLGATLWQHETTDTSATVPSTMHLQPSVPYYWRVEARTGFDRATRSDLVGFSLRRPRAP